jgi:uncharacterized membrane protein YeaQ/YmgE (transglycosylase-associated protein family)
VSIFTWIVLGLVSGFIATSLVNRHGDGVVVDVVLGVGGAVIGGVVFNAVGSIGVTGFNVWSLFVAIVGAVLVLASYHAIGISEERGARRTATRPDPRRS